MVLPFLCLVETTYICEFACANNVMASVATFIIIHKST